jgi:hypothetical protein
MMRKPWDEGAKRSYKKTNLKRQEITRRHLSVPFVRPTLSRCKIMATMLMTAS